MKEKSIDKDKLDYIAECYVKGDVDKSVSLYEKLMEEMRQARIEYLKENPIDAPNNVLNHAIIEGIGISNDFILDKGEYSKLFEIQNEEFKVWTHTEDEYSDLISFVNPKVKDDRIWKTGISILEIAFSMSKGLEIIYQFDYDWIYRFNNHTEKNELHYLKNRHDVFSNKSILRIVDFSSNASLIELLDRDDKFFVACQNIIAAKQNHEFCQICALTPEHLRKHKDYEPEIWEKISIVPRLESAIVLSTRSVEAILGKPGNRESTSKLNRFKERWAQKTDLEPDENYRLVDKSYIDYYYDLFGLRGFAAHSFGELSFNMKRKQTIEAQSFAWILISKYYEKHSIDNNQALEKLKFNVDLIKKFKDVNISTQSTKSSKYAP